MTTIIRPLLSSKVSSLESRTEAFAQQNFGMRERGVALDLHLPPRMGANQLLATEVLLDLCLRMDPVISEVRIHGNDDVADELVVNAAARFPLAREEHADGALDRVAFAIGKSDLPYVDVSDWIVGFNAPVQASPAGVVGPFLGAIEAAKYIFLAAVQRGYRSPGSGLTWTCVRVFDAWRWDWRTDFAEPPDTITNEPKQLAVAVIGCGGVGAAYLWFLRKTSFVGELLMVDDDVIKWHNMNRLPYATLVAAQAAQAKVVAAADYMAAGWEVKKLVHKAEHDTAVSALESIRGRGGLIVSAVGEPEARKYLGRRRFSQFFDGGTNSDGWARALALAPGISKCSECQVQAGHRRVNGACGEAVNEAFSGVVPHLASYAGVLVAIEQLRMLYGAPVLGGANTQSIFLDLEPRRRIATLRCEKCPFGGG